MDPTLHGNESAGSRSEEQMDEARKARRRLLKLGAASAPLVLTFRPSSAWANSAGCLLQHGNLPIPGRIIKVDTYWRPIPDYYGSGYGYTTYDNGSNSGYSDSGYNSGYSYDQSQYRRRVTYKTIRIRQRVGHVADADMRHSKLRALVYNDNMGMSCLNSITTF
ncbi:hypothetical protein [Pelagibius sp. Alg239-R121]|uniref:hypothetical protein n=1 Tax=Pelagibius sp. Alg239-R121 TaxID=2993448 RepID=UPI0024A6DD38|nr:hypothetical protein [Pelagibius sp. Alg239-R121]